MLKTAEFQYENISRRPYSPQIKSGVLAPHMEADPDLSTAAAAAEAAWQSRDQMTRSRTSSNTQGKREWSCMDARVLFYLIILWSMS